MGRAIGILVADGSDGNVIKKIRKAATDAGAAVKIIAPKVGGAKLADGEIAAVTSYVRSQWGNSASAISAATVAAERGATSGQNAPWQGGDELARFR